jgi:murein DD-endopeptidase MepM/ murein hydrolase activator NlpD
MTLRHPRRMLALLAAVVSVTAAQAGGATRALGVTIDSGPSGTVTSTDATFAFSARGGAGTVGFTCTLDRSTAGCTAPKTYTGLAPGAHAFAVTATDARGARASDRRSWTISPPEAPPPPPPPPAEPTPPAQPAQPAKPAATKRIKKNLCRPRRALGKPISLGCSALQVVTNTELAQPFANSLAKGMGGLGTIGPLKQATPGVLRDLKHGKHLIELGLHEAAHGDVCGGAHTAAAGTKLLNGSAAALDGVVDRLQKGLKPPAGNAGGDADELDALWHELGYRAKLVDDAVDAGNDVGAVLQKTCGSITGKATLHGLVAESGDGSRLLRLANGKAVVLPAGRLRNGPSEGTKAAISAVRFKDGTLYAVDVKASSGLGTKLAGKPYVPIGVLPCLYLRIAPSSQSFLDPANVTLHYPAAYKVNGVLRLEGSMRLGVKAGGCPEASNAGDEYFNRYSMQVSMTYEDAVTAKTTTTDVAWDFEAGELALLPASIAPGVNATIAAEVRWETCTYVPNGFYVDQYGDAHPKKKLECSVPQTLSTETWTAKVLPADETYFAIEYENVTLAPDGEQLVFDLEDDDLSGFRPATLGGIKTNGATVVMLPGTNPYVSARGFLVTGGASSKPQFKTLQQGDTFAVYNVDAWNPGSPMVKGTRNGKPFWYKASLPKLVRDALNFCSGVESYYRMPWFPGMQRKVAQGNNTTFTHKGPQKYAFDFGLSEGQVIRAARGGTVTWVVESLWKNSDPNWTKDHKEDWEPANALRIEHVDGSASWYYHMQQNGVLVAEGDKIHRGDEVALTGNTGNSTNAHLHYQVQSIPTEWEQSIEIKFQSVGNSCYIPQKDEWPMSNNT